MSQSEFQDNFLETRSSSLDAFAGFLKVIPEFDCTLDYMKVSAKMKTCRTYVRRTRIRRSTRKKGSDIVISKGAFLWDDPDQDQ